MTYTSTQFTFSDAPGVNSITAAGDGFLAYYFITGYPPGSWLGRPDHVNPYEYTPLMSAVCQWRAAGGQASL